MVSKNYKMARSEALYRYRHYKGELGQDMASAYKSALCDLEMWNTINPSLEITPEEQEKIKRELDAMAQPKKAENGLTEPKKGSIDKTTSPYNGLPLAEDVRSVVDSITLYLYNGDFDLALETLQDYVQEHQEPEEPDYSMMWEHTPKVDH